MLASSACWERTGELGGAPSCTVGRPLQRSTKLKHERLRVRVNFRWRTAASSSPRASAEAPDESMGRKRRPFRMFPLSGAGFPENRQTPHQGQAPWWEGWPRPVLRRYASLLRHWRDPVFLFHRQVRAAWSWPRPRVARSMNTTSERHVS